MHFISFARHWVRMLVTLGLSAGVAHAQATKDWTVVDLTPDSPGGGFARSVNNRGDVVGHTLTPAGGFFNNVAHAFLWRNGVREDIGSAAGRNSVAMKINENGTIVGQVDGFAYLWKDGVATSLNVAGTASAVNNRGDIVGTYWSGGAIGSGQERPFLIRGGVLNDLPTLGVAAGIAVNDVNDAGVATGFAIVPSTSYSHAVVWQDLAIRDLGTLEGGTQSFAYRLDNRGDVAGVAQDASGARFMVRWSVNGGAPEKLLPNFIPAAINQRGDIAGNDTLTGAPLLYRNGEVTNLLSLPAMQAGGWKAFTPLGMNDRGWIVGNAWKPGAPFWGTALLLMPS